MDTTDPPRREDDQRVGPPRKPVPVDHLAAIPPDLTTRPIPPHRPCDSPLTCGGPFGADPTLYCPPCRDLAEWRRIQRERIAERERLNSALREFQALCKHFPDLMSEFLLPLLAPGIGELVVKLTRGGRRRG